jgi:hypothetical protein
VILDLVLIGLVITLEPLALTAFILVLLSKWGVQKGGRVRLRLAVVTGNRDRDHPPGHREQTTPTEHGSVSGRSGRQNSDRDRAACHRRATTPPDGAPEEAEDPKMAIQPGQHVAMVRHRACFPFATLGIGGGRSRHHRRGQARVVGQLYRRHPLLSYLDVGLSPWRSMPLSDLHRPRRSWVACARGLTHTPTRSSLWLRGFSASRLLVDREELLLDRVLMNSDGSTTTAVGRKNHA